MFNAEDRIHDPVDGYPIGYFISRLVASAGGREAKKGDRIPCSRRAGFPSTAGFIPQDFLAFEYHCDVFREACFRASSCVHTC